MYLLFSHTCIFIIKLLSFSKHLKIVFDVQTMTALFYSKELVIFIVVIMSCVYIYIYIYIYIFI